MRYPIIKSVSCTDCVKFEDWGDGEMMCADPTRKATVDSGFDFSKPHICKRFVKRKVNVENQK